MRKNFSFPAALARNSFMFDGPDDVIIHGDIRYIRLFGEVECFILALDCINFINLSTGKFRQLTCEELSVPYAVIAVPLSWYMMKVWLEDYKYKTEITWDVFIFSGMIAVVIALLTVSYQSIRAALANPANNLRSE
jgi:hypothetical protein